MLVRVSGGWVFVGGGTLPTSGHAKALPELVTETSRERCGGVVITVGLGAETAAAGQRGLGAVVAAAAVAVRLSHVLLPSMALVRRADVVDVIGQALAAAAAGAGTRRAAEQVGRSVETVRGWLRRLRARGKQLRMLFTALLVEVGPDPVPPAVAGNPVADTVSAIAGAAASARSRWPGVIGEVPVWRFTAAVSHGRLLAPGWPPDVPA